MRPVFLPPPCRGLGGGADSAPRRSPRCKRVRRKCGRVAWAKCCYVIVFFTSVVADGSSDRWLVGRGGPNAAMASHVAEAGAPVRAVVGAPLGARWPEVFSAPPGVAVLSLASH